jgi:hypothetical protein
MSLDPVISLGEYRLSRKDKEVWMGTGGRWDAISGMGITLDHGPHPLLRDLDLVDELDPVQAIRSPIWHRRNARVGTGVFDAQDWHKDDFDGAWQLVWASRNPTVLRWKGHQFQPKPYELLLFNNSKLIHKSPVFTAGDLKHRWFMRVFLTAEFAPYRLTEKRLARIKSKMKE